MTYDRLQLLQTFIRIAERGSLSGAARDLGVSQPSVSRQLAALEQIVGSVLATRTTHQLALTSEGKQLLADARRLLADWAAIEERSRKGGELSGDIRAIVPIALGQTMMADIAAQFLKQNRQVSIDWRLTDEPIRFAEEGCDIWIKIGAVPDSSLIVRELAQIERLVVASPNLVEGSGGNLENLTWVTLAPFEAQRVVLVDERGREVDFEVRSAMRTDNILAVRQAVLNGIGAAILPRWFVAEAMERDELVNAAPQLRARSLPLNIAYAAGTRRPERVDRFIEFVSAEISKITDL